MIVDILFVSIVIVLIYAIYRIKFKNQTAKINNLNIDEIQQAAQANNNGTTATRPQQRQPAQNENMPRWAQRQQQQQQQQSGSQGSQQQGDKKQLTLADRKKQLRKQQKARQKQQRKQALQHHLQQQKKQKQKQQLQQQQQQRIAQQKKRKQDQHYRILVQQQQARKKAQYNKWKSTFTVQTQGKQSQSLQQKQKQKQQLLQSILGTLKKNKLCLLEDLAHKYKLNTGELIERIKELEARGSMKGIFDQRGKYMVIQANQWDAVRNYIQTKGRVKKTDIMNQCAKIIKIPDGVDEEFVGLVGQEAESA